MKPTIQPRLSQQLSLTPQLQQAIRLLQLSRLELTTELRQLAEANPLLDFIDDSMATETGEPDAPAAADDADVDWDSAPDTLEDASLDFTHLPVSGTPAQAPDFETRDAAPETLRDHLMWQLGMASMSAREYAIAEVIIDALDNNGYLPESPDALLAAFPAELVVTPEELESVRRQVQQFDPVGVASVNLRDCLDAQLRQLQPDTPQVELARCIVADELDLLAHNNLDRLSRRLRAEPEDVADACALIRQLDPHPGAALDTTPVEYIIPDAYVRRHGNQWLVSLSPHGQPRLELNQHYCGLIREVKRDDAAWLRGQLQEARWLLKSLEARSDTILKVANAIVRRQKAFLEYGPEAMRPLVLREIAEEVDMHESTISRVTTRKYLNTPRGNFEFKYFFSSGVATDDGGTASSTAIQAMLRKLVDQEDPRKPLSDKALADAFEQRGINVARRTIAKYREALRIPSSSERRRAG
ncbi:MAG TPA: RNA polymerase factor sigma-54 [Rhodanobacteraceae bacterium]|nr:RNA polymerase factor sigma-54 [Rhodanobacteraceae bacterium]